jgi:hypothetical protein
LRLLNIPQITTDGRLPYASRDLAKPPAELPANFEQELN